MSSRGPQLALLGAAAAGAGMALQAAANAGLGGLLHSAPSAALWSFGSGLVLVTVLVLLKPSSRAATARLYRGIRRREISLPMTLGGAIGAALVAVQAFVVPTLGVALATIAIIAGQVAAGLLVDAIGFGPGGRRRPGARRLIGAGLIVVAVVVSSLPQMGDQAGVLALAALPFLAGFGMAFQQAANGQVRAFCGDAMATTFNNFLVGTLALALLLGGLMAAGHRPQLRLPELGEAWMLLGGAFGVGFISMAAVIVAQLGVLLLGLGTVFGQLAASLTLDALMPELGHPVTAYSIVGVAIALTGVLVASPRQPPGPKQRIVLEE